MSRTYDVTAALSVRRVLAALLFIALTACQQEELPRSSRAPQGADDSASKKSKRSDNDDGWETGDSTGKTSIDGDDKDSDKDDTDKEDTTDTDKDDDTDDKKPDENTNNDGGKTSGGSGGKTGLTEVTFRAANGQNSSYKINAPEDASGKAYGLHIHLHGDGGGGYRDYPNKVLRENLIGVTVKAPNRNLQWGRSEGVPHAEYVQDLIQNEILKKYNIQLDRIYFSGVSGGAYFLTGSFLPQFGHHYNSGAFILCGGEAPRVAFAQPEMLKTFRIYWQVTAGERSDITANVRQSINAYDQALTKVLSGDSSFDKKIVQDTETKGPGGHCEFDDRSYTTGIQFIIDSKFSVVFKK